MQLKWVSFYFIIFFASVVVMDEGNDVVKGASRAAFEFLSSTGTANVGKLAMLEFSMEYNSASIENAVCTEVDKMVDEGNPPDLILDLTTKGLASDIVQSFSLSLGIPTVAATFADVGGLK